MAATSAPTSEYRRAAPDSVVSAANGIDYAYRQIGGGTPVLVLLQHCGGNLDNSRARSTCSASRSAASSPRRSP